eukprot:CAMPEP_0197408820 /NCGR_PEP_ID=MMETSP1165-20131217/28998_1 /TAXON_ID=284809 /ORGANISM="Chrysocystis fragilis, Strain CCMP3189" /LENGTH=241 /DNA_ID=CAMNT_0042935255 /DNA_START=384 /DNA_END=1106 /DNA_ORIENTATION=-
MAVEEVRGEDGGEEGIEDGAGPSLEVAGDEAVVVESVGGLADEGGDGGSPGEAEDALEAPEGLDLVAAGDADLDEVAARAPRVEESRERVGELRRAADGHVGVRGVEEAVGRVERGVEAARDVVPVRRELALDVGRDFLRRPVPAPLDRIVRGHRHGEALVSRREEPHHGLARVDDVGKPSPPKRAADLVNSGRCHAERFLRDAQHGGRRRRLERRRGAGHHQDRPRRAAAAHALACLPSS